MTSPDRLAELAADARYHRERLQLYRAKGHGSRPTSVARLRELERLCEHAERRLRKAKQAEVKSPPAETERKLIERLKAQGKSKGALAAERASAGIGTDDRDPDNWFRPTGRP
jgi:hypothetical protein